MSLTVSFAVSVAQFPRMVCSSKYLDVWNVFPQPSLGHSKGEGSVFGVFTLPLLLISEI